MTITRPTGHLTLPGGLFSCLHFFYDASNKPAIVEFNGTKYAYVHNLQGDIVAILDSTGTKVVEYKYDAWGRPISKTGSLASTLGTVQPFRYRGYVYDEETGLYYLRSRYYSHLLMRFVSADACIGTKAEDLCGKSLFTYCSNNPICRSDPDGDEWWKWAIGAVAVVGCIALIGFTAGAALGVAAGFKAAGLATISIGLAAADGGICAIESGGDFVDGALAGAIGGSIGSLPIMLGPAAHPIYSILGRGASSAIYDVTYEWFSTGTIDEENIPLYVCDVTMDMAYSTVVYYYTGDNRWLSTFANGVADGTVDVLQTMLFNGRSEDAGETYIPAVEHGGGGRRF